MSAVPGRALFVSAGVLEASAGLPLLAAPEVVARVAGIAVSEPASLFVRVAGLAVIGFAWIYGLVARDPVRHRSLVPVAMVVKLAVAAVLAGYWAQGLVAWHLPALGLVQAAYAAAFFRWYLRTGAPHARVTQSAARSPTA